MPRPPLPPYGTYGSFTQRLEVFSMRLVKDPNFNINGEDPGIFKGIVLIRADDDLIEIYNSNSDEASVDYYDIEEVLPNDPIPVGSKRKFGPPTFDEHTDLPLLKGSKQNIEPPTFENTGLPLLNGSKQKFRPPPVVEHTDLSHLLDATELELPVMGPDVGMMVYDIFTLVVHMDSGNAALEAEYLQIALQAYLEGPRIFIEGDAVTQWIPVWKTCDKFNTLKIGGDFGILALDYIVFNDSKEVELDVTLVMDEGGGRQDGEENDADIYIGGTLFLTSDKFPDHESVLLKTPTDKFLNVTPGKPIPLIKRVVSLPYHSGFTVDANLFLPDNVSIVQGSASCEFVFLNIDKPSDTSMLNIIGIGWKIQVKATVHLW